MKPLISLALSVIVLSFCAASSISCQNAPNSTSVATSPTSTFLPVPTKKPVKKPKMSQAEQDKDQIRFLNSCFASLKRRNKQARVIVKVGYNLTLLPGTRDLRVGSAFEMRDRHGRFNYTIKNLDANGLHIRYRIVGMSTYGLNAGGTGQITLAWK